MVRVVADIASETGVADVVYELAAPISTYFADRTYGTSVRGIGVVLMCRSPDLHFHRRRRFSKRELVLYLDVMLDYFAMVAANHATRRRIVVQRLREELINELRRRRWRDFDLAAFEQDLTTVLLPFSKPPSATGS